MGAKVSSSPRRRTSSVTVPASALRLSEFSIASAIANESFADDTARVPVTIAPSDDSVRMRARDVVPCTCQTCTRPSSPLSAPAFAPSENTAKTVPFATPCNAPASSRTFTRARSVMRTGETGANSVRPNNTRSVRPSICGTWLPSSFRASAVTCGATRSNRSRQVSPSRATRSSRQSTSDSAPLVAVCASSSQISEAS